MSGRNEAKLKHLLRDWPKGTAATQRWLETRGIYRQLTRRYLTSGWIERLGRGAFTQAGDTVDWLGGVQAIQAQLRLPIWVGGVTALRRQGFGQYVPLGPGEVVHLFSDEPVRLPAWFKQRPWSARPVHHCLRLFDGAANDGFTELDRGTFTVRASSLERAILELMRLATSNAALDHALEVFGGLTTLRPAVVQTLLEACRSARVKRLFLWAAEQAEHAWLGRLDLRGISLGTGKRVIYDGGRFDPKYQITVPEPERLPDV